ncbi:MAG: hypothetical protein HY930_02145 [Euryarchaeota archaeon]|nr:hypothetical protein [Euryarchaeota archaeon]
MKREIEGTLVREKDSLGIKTSDGKTKLIYNIFDGFSGKKIRVTVEEVEG